MAATPTALVTPLPGHFLIHQEGSCQFSRSREHTHLLWGQEIPFPAGFTELQEHTEVDTGSLVPLASLPAKASPTHKLPRTKGSPISPQELLRAGR